MHLAHPTDTATLDLHPPQKVTIVQSIIDQILMQIRNQALRPGDRLPSERELIATLGVSRSSVREALQGLVAMNVLESRPGQGTFVRPHAPSLLWQLRGAQPSQLLQKKMRLDLLHTRALIDQEVTQLVVQDATEASLAEITTCFEEYEASVRLGDQVRIAVTHGDFHTAIARASDNYFLLRVTELLLNEALPSSLRNPEYRFEQDSPPEGMLGYDLDNHRAIYDAIMARNAELVRAAIQNHVELTLSLIEADFAETSG